MADADIIIFLIMELIDEVAALILVPHSKANYATVSLGIIDH